MCKKGLSALLLVLLLAQPAWASLPSGLQGEAQEEDPLEKSIALIEDTLSLIRNIQSDNELLKNTNEALETALTNVSDMLQLQGQLPNESAAIQAEQSAISQRQSFLLGRELKKGKILTVSLIVSVPVCIGLGIWVGTMIK